MEVVGHEAVAQDAHSVPSACVNSFCGENCVFVVMLVAERELSGLIPILRSLVLTSDIAKLES